MKKNISIYVHIPFCFSKCYYCDFNSYAGKENLVESYIDSLCKEIISNSEILTEYNIDTIYFGGGTPSFIDSKYIKQVLDILSMFNTNDEAEITIEVNPNSLTQDKAIEYKKMGINRVSIGLQTTYDDVLKNIGRKHKKEDFINSLKYLKEAGIKNISCDLIYPLPGLNLDSFKASVDEVVSLSDEYNIKHISIYNLEVHENTKLDFLLKEGFLSLVDEDEEYEMRKYLNCKLNDSSFIKYEISNFGKEGFYSRHNINYWKQGYYLGFGAGASSFFGGSRYTNVKSIEEYINDINNNMSAITEREDMNLLELISEYIILRLRLKEGVDLREFEKRFGKSIFEYYDKQINSLRNKGLINVTDTTINLTKRGAEVANLVWEEFV